MRWKPSAQSGGDTIRSGRKAPDTKVALPIRGGIPRRIFSRIFEPYFTSKTNGFGLGLAATWNILQSHRPESMSVRRLAKARISYWTLSRRSDVGRSPR